MITSRRKFLTGLGATLVAAPAIVRAGSLMPVRQMIEPPRTTFIYESNPDGGFNTFREIYFQGRMYWITGIDNIIHYSRPCENPFVEVPCESR